MAMAHLLTRRFRFTKSATAKRAILPKNLLSSINERTSHGGDAFILGIVTLGLLATLGEAYLRTGLHDAHAPGECAYSATDELLTWQHVRTLEREGLVVIPNALDLDALKGARRDLFRFIGDDAVGADGTKNSDGSGGLGLTSNDDDVRQDRIAWVQASNENEVDTHNDVQKIRRDNAAVEKEDMGLGEHMEHCIRLVRGVTHALEEHDYVAPKINVIKKVGPSKQRMENLKRVDEQQQRPASKSHHITSAKFKIPRECQLAFYPGDGSALYKRHLDQCHYSIWELGLLEWLRLSDYRARSVTVILYLNCAERPRSDGGALRCWVEKSKIKSGLRSVDNDNVDYDATINDDNDECDNGDSGNIHLEDAKFYAPFDVQPTGGTMVVFQSDKVEHMVLPSLTDRYAITNWVSRVPGT